MHIDIYVALAGLIVGFAVGLTGMGGGALMTPILVLVFGIAPLAAVSSDLVASLIMKPVGAAVHAGRGTVRWNLAGWLALGSVPSAFLGVVFLKSVGSGSRVQTIVSVALGAVLLLAVGALVVKMYLDHRNGTGAGVDEKLRIKKVPTLAIGASIGFIVGITSVGSGTLVIILLLFLYPRLRGSQMVGHRSRPGDPDGGLGGAGAHPVRGFQARADAVDPDREHPRSADRGERVVVRADGVPARCPGGGAARVRAQAGECADALDRDRAPRLRGRCSAPPGCTSGPAAAPCARSPARRQQLLAGTHRDFTEEPALQTAGSLSEA